MHLIVVTGKLFVAQGLSFTILLVHTYPIRLLTLISLFIHIFRGANLFNGRQKAHKGKHGFV